MKILIALSYYRPHTSGLTIYVERLARGLESRGHYVTVLTSHFRHDLPYYEVIEGVHVVRLPVALKLSKGVIQPGITLRYLAQALKHDVISIHLPQAEAGAMTLIGRYLARKPVVLTYHCDLQLPPGFINRFIDRMTYATNRIGVLFADRVIAYTDDYAVNSPMLAPALDKVVVIPPPVVMPAPMPDKVAQLKARFSVNGCRVVGFAARLAEEKGVDYLIKSIPYVRQRIPDVKYLLAGPTHKVIGENVWERLQPLVAEYKDTLHFVGEVPNKEMGNFFAACDVVTVPSVNSTESFGLVQVESMLSGTPVVASNLPGVREPVRMTGMGQVVPIRDERALGEAIVQVIEERKRYVRPRAEIENLFAIDATLAAYERVFEELRQGRSR